MVKSKKGQSNHADVGVENGSASQNQTVDHATDLPAGARRAKANALTNPVWKELVPGARKRAASTTSKSERKKAKHKDKSNTEKNKDKLNTVKHDTPVSNARVSIPVPGAPQKKGRASKGATAASDNQTGRKADIQADPIIEERVNEEDGEEDNSPSETDTGSDTGEDYSEDEDMSPAVNSKAAGDALPRTRTHAAADKRFANEQPVWAEDISNNASNNHARGARHVAKDPLFDISDEEKPDVSQLDTRKTLIIRGQVIEISDDEDGNVNDDSPTARLVPASDSANRESLQVVKVASLRRTESVDSQPDQPAMTQTNNRTSVWPRYTDLVRGQRDLLLTVQCFEIRLIVRKAMDLVEERVRFEDAYPNLVNRTVWNGAALIKACEVIKEMSPIGQVKERYDIFKERIRVDIEYVGEISKSLLDPRISILRGDTKILAVNNARVAYGLQDSCGKEVKILLNKSSYIYPRAANGFSFQRNKPYENSAIVGTIRDDLFAGSNTVLLKFQHRFKKEPDQNMLTPSVIALAATAVYACLKEWESGFRVTSHFTTNLFEMVYRTHLKHLEKIREENETAYMTMLRRLFRLAAASQQGEVDDFDLTDMQNMATTLN
ncbi:hypothetical protein M378DRAFT_179510 [Amanita muscaria Koide BX008]|uniref:DUF6532 domain-containing protein n=1 Tax=Amanita muscaria (strain Koide BX008) TaxID=946122 RepID=A0A0C2WMT2_AMAMK|nr:hypothetical protein M378DRAFT_179510 [Amanita muscaria Koide BX008]